MITYILFFLLFVVPYVILPFGVTQFENPKVIVSEVAIILMAILFFFTKDEKNRYHVASFKKSSRYLFITLGILTLLHIILSQDQSILIFGNAFRLQGIFLLLFLLVFSYVSAFYKLPRVRWGVYVLLLFIELITMFFLLPINESNRYVGTMGEPNATAAYAIFVWPFAYFSVAKLKKHHNTVKALIFSCVLGVLFLTQSRSALVAVLIQLIFLFSLIKNWSKKAIHAMCFSLLFLSYTLPFIGHVQYEDRVEVWQSAISANDSTTKILIGNGFGNIETAIKNTAVKLDLPIQHNYVDSAHNILLDWWVGGGLVGVVLLLGFIYFAVKTFIEKNDSLELVLLFGLLTALSFNPASIASLLAFWWLVGKGLVETKN